MVWRVEAHDGLRLSLWACDKETWWPERMVGITVYLVIRKEKTKKEEL